MTRHTAPTKTGLTTVTETLRGKKTRTPTMACSKMGKRDVATGLPAVMMPRGRRLNCQTQIQQLELLFATHCLTPLLC